MTGMVDAGKEKGRMQIHHFCRNESFFTCSIDLNQFIDNQTINEWNCFGVQRWEFLEK
jgi:hypothetical protein